MPSPPCPKDGSCPNPLSRSDECVHCHPEKACPHNRIKNKCRECMGDKVAIKQKPLCPHGKRKSRCKECGGASLCEHGRRRSQCKDCGGTAICEHNKLRRQCKLCQGAAMCVHGRLKAQCKDCKGKSICPHGKRRTVCAECGGGSLCIHKRQKYTCKECKGGGICEHGKRKKSCKICAPLANAAKVAICPPVVDAAAATAVQGLITLPAGGSAPPPVSQEGADTAAQAVAATVGVAAQATAQPVVGQKRNVDGSAAGSQGDGYSETLQMSPKTQAAGGEQGPAKAPKLDQFLLPVGSHASAVVQQQMDLLAPPLNANPNPAQPPGMGPVGQQQNMPLQSMPHQPIGQQRPIGRQMPPGTYMRQPIGQQRRPGEAPLLGPNNPLLGPSRPQYRTYGAPQQLRGWPAPTPPMPSMAAGGGAELGQQNPLLQVQQIPGQNQFLSQIGQQLHRPDLLGPPMMNGPPMSYQQPGMYAPPVMNSQPSLMGGNQDDGSVPLVPPPVMGDGQPGSMSLMTSMVPPPTSVAVSVAVEESNWD